MEEQLELIQRLRLEVNNLISYKNKNKQAYDTADDVVLSTFNYIQYLYVELEKNKVNFDNLKFIKTFRFSIFIGISIATSIFLPTVVNSFNQIFIKVLGSVIFGAIGFLLTSTFLSSSRIVNNFLIKKYSEIRDSYNKVNNLEIAIRIGERHFEKLKKNRDNLKITLKALEEQLDRKKEELDSVEEEYFDSLVGKTFITEDGKHYTVGIAARGKTKIRTPDISKNLGN